MLKNSSRIGTDQVAILRWKCAISTGGIFFDRSIFEHFRILSSILLERVVGHTFLVIAMNELCLHIQIIAKHHVPCNWGWFPFRYSYSLDSRRLIALLIFRVLQYVYFPTLLGMLCKNGRFLAIRRQISNRNEKTQVLLFSTKYISTACNVKNVHLGRQLSGVLITDSHF